jgi:hypothetical protein
MLGFYRSLVSGEEITPCLFHFCSHFIPHHRMIIDEDFLWLFIHLGLVYIFYLVCLMQMHSKFQYVCWLLRLALEYYCILEYQVVINSSSFVNLDMLYQMLLLLHYHPKVYSLHYLVLHYIIHVLMQFVALSLLLDFFKPNFLWLYSQHLNISLI